MKRFTILHDASSSLRRNGRIQGDLTRDVLRGSFCITYAAEERLSPHGFSFLISASGK